MHRPAIIVVVLAALVGLAVGLTIAWQEDELPTAITGEPKVVGAIPWSLFAVSADARTLTITHEVPHCETKPGKLTVDETPTSVVIRLDELQVDFSDEIVCTADLRISQSTVRLAAPLGTRTLEQPRDRAPGREPDRRDVESKPGSQECAKLATLPPKAPARDVPWVQRRLVRCAAPLPARFRAFPFMQRARTKADRLPSNFDEDAGPFSTILRYGLSRRLDRRHRIWLVPGPELSCLARSRDGQTGLSTCRPTAQLARRGLVTPAICSPGRTPERIVLLGITPPGVREVRIAPERGRPTTVPVRDGTFATASVGYPFVLRYGDQTVASDSDFRSCA